MNDKLFSLAYLESQVRTRTGAVAIWNMPEVESFIIAVCLLAIILLS